MVLGTGDPHYEQFLTDLAAVYPERVGVRIAYDNALAHKIEAGADIFLMPSQYEPSGLNQMFSLRYGTVPVVRSTGGLADTIDEETGFKFDEYSGDGFARSRPGRAGGLPRPGNVGRDDAGRDAERLLLAGLGDRILGVVPAAGGLKPGPDSASW